LTKYPLTTTPNLDNNAALIEGYQLINTKEEELDWRELSDGGSNTWLRGESQLNPEAILFYTPRKGRITIPSVRIVTLQKIRDSGITGVKRAINFNGPLESAITKAPILNQGV